MHELLTTGEAAKMLGVTPRRVVSMIGSGQLPASKMGRDYVIKRSDVEQVVKRPGPGRPPIKAKK